MRSECSFTVNGQPCSHVVLTTDQPIPDLDFLRLRYVSDRGPFFTATPADYEDGAYHFNASPPHSGTPGVYRVRAVDVFYTDGSSATAEPGASIEIDVPAIPKRAEHLPQFTAR